MKELILVANVIRIEVKEKVGSEGRMIKVGKGRESIRESLEKR